MSEQATRIASGKMSEVDTHCVCYGKAPEGWWVYLPACGVGFISAHTVEEHGDGTISVTPSILLTGHDSGNRTERHGYLTKGVWNEC